MKKLSLIAFAALVASCSVKITKTDNPQANMAKSISKAYAEMGNKDSAAWWHNEYKRLKKQ